MCGEPSEVEDLVGPFGLRKVVSRCTACWWDSLHADEDVSFGDAVRLFLACWFSRVGERGRAAAV